MRRTLLCAASNHLCNLQLLCNSRLLTSGLKLQIIVQGKRESLGNTVGSPPIKHTHGSRDTSTFSSAHGSFVSSLMRCPSAPYLIQQSKRDARGQRWHTQSEHFGDCVHLAAPTRREPERRLPIRDAAHGRAHETCNPGIVQTSRIFPVCFATPSSHSSTLRFCFGSGRWAKQSAASNQGRPLDEETCSCSTLPSAPMPERRFRR